MLIDTHCHLASKIYKKTSPSKSINEILKEAEKNNVKKVITVGTSLEDNLETFKIAQNFSNVYFSMGVYPHENINLAPRKITKKLKSQIKQIEESKNVEKLIGIGECGIDIRKDTNKENIKDYEDKKMGKNSSNRKKKKKNNSKKGVGSRNLKNQIKLFESQTKLAIKKDLPLIVHNRNADEVILKVLKKYNSKNLRGVIHTFTSSWEFAKKVLDLNFYLSFSGIITYNSGKSILETVKKVPKNKFLVETDAPYLTPKMHRGKINCPKYVRITAQKIADTKNLPLKEIENLSTKNAHTLFKLL